ncbi:glycoside hydrolase domain-containing protein [Pedobacter jamesrossensis]|uniref:Glycoside hydrolase domain-containing protein n=1 Tax=Pedobacter jamesrossensis TaxID=1908238 RepID=A0ABV8NS63_9SPHI
MIKLISTTLVCIISLSVFAQKSREKKPIKSLNIIDHTISIDGRKFEINNDGFPKQIESFFSDNVESFTDKPTRLLYEPIHFHFFNSAKFQEKMSVDKFDLISKTIDSIVWMANSFSPNIKMDVRGKMQSNGFVSYQVNLRALNDVEFTNINFHIPFDKGEAKYLAGLGQKNYLRPDTVKWSWKDGKNIKPAVWIGTDSTGLYLSINDKKDAINFINGWNNQNKGDIKINIKGSSMLTDVSTGSLVMHKDDELSFDFNLILTPLAEKGGREGIAKRFNVYRKIDLKESNK